MNARLRLPVTVLAAAWLGLSTSRCGPGRPPIVFILSGQSNMVGQGRSVELPDSLRVPPGNVRFFEDGSVTPLGAGPTFGPEVAFGHGIVGRYPGREIILIKYAVGGTSLLAWAPDWDSTRAAITGNVTAGPLYARLLGHIEEAGVPPNAEYGAVLWVQGERDARYPEAGTAYGDNLVTLIERLRTDLGVPGLPFLLARVNPPADRYPALDPVRRAQEGIANRLANVAMVDADGLSKRDDDVHYDTDGILELGRRFAHVWLDRADQKRQQ